MPMHIDHMPFTVEREPLVELEGPHQRCTFYLSKSALDKIRVNGPRWKFYNADLIDEGILNPCSIFTGLKRKEYDDGLCYISSLPRRYDNDGQLQENRSDRLFLVFVKKFMGLVVFDWEFRERSRGNPNFPVNHGEDFEDWLWQKH